jgi:hypothetical protein
MTDQGLSGEIDQLRGQLAKVEAQLAKSAGAPEGLEDLKAAVDSLRISVWAVLSASRSSNYPGFIARFRLRRGIEILRSILADLETEAGRAPQPEHSELQILMQQLNEKVGRLRTGG